MPRPATGVLTTRLFDRLPDLYRAADEERDWPLLRYLSTLLDQASDIEVIVDRIDYVPAVDGGTPGDTSELVDPDLADAAWLPWLAQLVGVPANRAPESFAMPYGELSDTWATYAALDAAWGTYGDQAEGTTEVTGGAATTEELRDAIRTASTGWRAGSEGSYEELVAPLLTGTKTVKVITHVGGNAWAIEVRTYEAETPEPWRVEAALNRARIKPAGVIVTVTTAAGATYAELDADFTDYAAMNAGIGTYEDQRTYIP